MVQTLRKNKNYTHFKLCAVTEHKVSACASAPCREPRPVRSTCVNRPVTTGSPSTTVPHGASVFSSPKQHNCLSSMGQ